jgi:lantibiotic modifying enzyme
MTSKGWRPLLEGDLAIRAREAVEAIALAIEIAPLAEIARGGSFAGGTAGFAVFYSYLTRSGGPDAERYAEQAERRLDESIEELATTPMMPGFYSGFTGVAWTAEHLSRMPSLEADADGGDAQEIDEDEENEEDANEEIDRALLTLLQQTPWRDQYDLISGLVGYGVYAIERFPRPSGVRCLEAVIDRLDETAERNEQGATWFTPPELLLGENRDRTPGGYYNLGLAHGVPGVIALLADACRLGIREETARPLLEGAVSWLLAQRRPDDGKSCYSWSVGPGIEPNPARTAWCYGDPGIAAALLYAARATGREDWEREALATARRAAATPVESAGAVDAGLCHGAFGLAHLYNRFYQATGEEPFAEAARFWYERGLEMRKPGEGVAGFLSYQPRMLGQPAEWIADPGFLTGASGVGLALVAGLSDVEPEWDRFLMVAIPPRQG